MLKEQQISEILEAIYAGQITATNLPREVYDAIIKTLNSSFVQGFGTPPGDLLDGSEAKRIADELQDNVRVFSAAKTFQQVKEMSGQIVDGAGNKRSFQDFRDIARETFDKYNDRWLKTEQDTAFNQSRSAKNWSTIQENKDLYPMLMYRTSGDKRVRDDHEAMEGIVRPVDDSFWDTHTPPNGWNCRCPKPRQMRSGTSSDVRGVPEPEDLFKMNAGKDGMIFKEDIGDGLEHPYFKVDQRFEVLKEQGFGLV